MNKYIKYIIWIAAFLFINRSLGTLAGVVFLALVIAFTLWNNRAVLLTRLAAQAYFNRGDVDKGGAYYEKAYKTGIMTSECKVSYSSFCIREGRLDKAKKLLREVINSRFSNDKDKIGAKHNLAVVLWREGNLNEGLSTIEEVHRKAKSSSTYGTYGVLLLERAKMGNTDDILPFMLEAYEYNEDDKTIADNLGELYYMLGEYEKAMEVYEKVMKQPLVTPVPFYNYGRVLKALGKNEEAKEMFEKALSNKFTRVITLTREMVEEELKSVTE